MDTYVDWVMQICHSGVEATFGRVTIWPRFQLFFYLLSIC